MQNKNIELMKTKRAGAFTLIELLVVIAIIGIIAGLIVNFAGKAATARRIARVKAELAQLETAIDSYNKKSGSFPPSNGNTNNVVTNQLFYELIGTVYKPDDKEFQPINGSEAIKINDIRKFFQTEGFANSADTNSAAEVKNFFPGLSSAQYRGVGPNVKLLIVPVEGPNDIDVNGKKINPWRYNSKTPTHNPDSYDLWAEILVGGRTNIIGNWKE